MNDSLGNLSHAKNNDINSKRMKLAAILGSLAAFAPLTIDMYLPALPLIAEELSTSQSFVQLSLTFFLVGLALGQLWIGPMSDSKGRRKPLLIGLIIYSIASILCAFSPTIWIFIFLRFVQGLSGAAGIVLSRAIVRDLYSGSEMTKFFSLLALVNGIAPILAPILGGVILLFAPWKAVFIILSFVGLAMFFVVLFYLPESRPVENRTAGGIVQTAKTFKRLFLDRSFIGNALSLAFVFTMMFAYISGSSFVLQNVYEVTPQVYSLIFALNGLGIVIAAQVTGRLAGKFGELKFLVIGITMAFLGASILLVMLLFQASLVLILLPLFIAISSMGIVSTTGQSLALQNQGKIAGSASALIGVLQYVLAGTAAPLTGLGANPAISMGIVMTLGSIGAILSFLFIVRATESKTPIVNQQ
nr:multidrug effflux MFS transporter [Lysinibacillus timonensis]